MMKAPAAWFIKEPSKTKQFLLEATAPAETLKKLKPAEILNFKIKGSCPVIADSEGRELGIINNGDLGEKILSLLRGKKKLTPILIGREKKKLAILVIAEENLFWDKSEEKELRPFTRLVDKEAPGEEEE